MNTKEIDLRVKFSLPSHDGELIFGSRAVIETILAGETLQKVFVQQPANKGFHKGLITLLQQHAIPHIYVPKEKLGRLTSKNHQGVVAYRSPISFANLSEVISLSYEKGELPFIVILDRVTDVHNFGAIVRTALCAGVDAILIPAKGSAAIGGDAMKTSTGALANLPICRVNSLSKSIISLQERGLQIIACHKKTTHLPYHSDFNRPIALLFGSEDRGISPSYLQLVNEEVHLPMVGDIGSLNVSVAAAIMMYERVRQKNL